MKCLPIETWIGEHKWVYLSETEAAIERKKATGKAQYPLCDEIFPDCPPVEERSLENPPRGCIICPYFNKTFLEEFKKKRKKEMKKHGDDE